MLDRSDHRADGLPQHCGVELVLLTAADRNQALGFEALRLMKRRHLAGLSGEFAGGAHFVEPGLGLRQAFAVLKQHHSHGIAFDFI